jgi:hypothetical protein
MTEYVQCPRCKGDGIVCVTTRPSNGFSPAFGETFTCNVCDGMRTIAADAAKRWHLVNDPEEHDDAA